MITKIVKLDLVVLEKRSSIVWPLLTYLIPRYNWSSWSMGDVKSSSPLIRILCPKRSQLIEVRVHWMVYELLWFQFLFLPRFNWKLSKLNLEFGVLNGLNRLDLNYDTSDSVRTLFRFHIRFPSRIQWGIVAVTDIWVFDNYLNFRYKIGSINLTPGLNSIS